MNQKQNGFFGTSLFGQALEPPRPRAALLIVHGICEHSGRYLAPARRLVEHGIACYLYDQRGHGRSPGPRTDVEVFEDFVRDLRTLALRIAAAKPDLPLFLWGHSMGSIVSLLAVESASHRFAGVVASGCPIATLGHVSSWLLPLAGLGARIVPRARIHAPLGAQKLTHDIELQRAYLTDPLVVRSTTLRLLVELGRACREARDDASAITLPLLLQHGEEDRIAPPRGSQELIEQVASTDKRLVLWPGQRHELHNESEPTRSAFLQALADWLMDRSPLKE